MSRTFSTRFAFTLPLASCTTRVLGSVAACLQTFSPRFIFCGEGDGARNHFGAVLRSPCPLPLVWMGCPSCTSSPSAFCVPPARLSSERSAQDSAWKAACSLCHITGGLLLISSSPCLLAFWCLNPGWFEHLPNFVSEMLHVNTARLRLPAACAACGRHVEVLCGQADPTGTLPRGCSCTSWQ